MIAFSRKSTIMSWLIRDLRTIYLLSTSWFRKHYVKRLYSKIVPEFFGVGVHGPIELLELGAQEGYDFLFGRLLLNLLLELVILLQPD